MVVLIAPIGMAMVVGITIVEVTIGQGTTMVVGTSTDMVAATTMGIATTTTTTIVVTGGILDASAIEVGTFY